MFAEDKAGNSISHLKTKSNALRRGSKDMLAELKNFEEEIVAKGEELRLMELSSCVHMSCLVEYSC